jgi:hypothetical protein
LVSNDVRNGNRKVCLVLVRKKEKKKKVDPAIAPISPREKKRKENERRAASSTSFWVGVSRRAQQLLCGLSTFYSIHLSGFFFF